MAEDAEKQEGKFSTTAEFENSLAASVSKNYGNSVMNSLRIIRSSSTIDWARGQQTSIIHPLQGTNQQTQNAAVDQTAFSRGIHNNCFLKIFLRGSTIIIRIFNFDFFCSNTLGEP